MIVALGTAVLDIVHLAAAKWSEAADNCAAASPAQGYTAAYLGAGHLVVSGCLPLSIAMRAGELDGGPLPNKAGKSLELTHLFQTDIVRVLLVLRTTYWRRSDWHWCHL